MGDLLSQLRKDLIFALKSGELTKEEFNKGLIELIEGAINNKEIFHPEYD